MVAAGSGRRQLPADAATSQLNKAGRPTPPLFPGDGAQPSPEPLVKLAQHRRGLAKTEVATPAPQINRQLLDDLPETGAAYTPRQFPNPAPKTVECLRRPRYRRSEGPEPSSGGFAECPGADLIA